MRRALRPRSPIRLANVTYSEPTPSPVPTAPGADFDVTRGPFRRTPEADSAIARAGPGRARRPVPMRRRAAPPPATSRRTSLSPPASEGPTISGITGTQGPTRWPGDVAPRCRLLTAGLLANRGNSGIELLLPGEADGGLLAIGWHLDVGRCQSRRRPPSRTINQSWIKRNSEHPWPGTWSPVMMVKLGPEGIGGDTSRASAPSRPRPHTKRGGGPRTRALRSRRRRGSAREGSRGAPP
jgi:hypothetical protein